MKNTSDGSETNTSFYSSFDRDVPPNHKADIGDGDTMNNSNAFLHDQSSGIQDLELEDERESILLLRRQLEQVHAIRLEGERKDHRLRDEMARARDLEAQNEILRTKLQVQACELERQGGRAAQSQQALIRAQQLANELSLAHQVSLNT
jgi:hypothetical protein